MSGSDIAGKFIATPPDAASVPLQEAGDRLAWPAAALLILVLSAALWSGIVLLASRLLG